MNIDTAIRGRRSTRRFTPDDVPEQIVTEVLELARWSPSWANTQPWSVIAVTGQTLERVKSAYRERATDSAPRRFEIPRPRPDWPPAMARRTQQLTASRASLPGPSDSAPGNMEFFGAPWLVLVAIDDRLQPEYACYDAGAFVQTLCLAAHGKGLGTCVMAIAVGYPDVLHALLPAAAGKRFVVGIALGVPDALAATNQVDRTRADLDEFLSFAR
jgi:nitroreductase